MVAMKTWKTKNGHKITRVLAGRSNVFLVSHDGKNILVDTSPGSRWKRLDAKLKELGIERLEALILTHAHYDHAGNAAKLQEKYEAKVIAHIAEGPCLTKGENSRSGGTNALTRFIFACLGKLFAQRLHYEPCRPGIQIDPSFELREYGFKAYILHTPGHTAGSLSVIIDDEIAVVGDTLFGVFPGRSSRPMPKTPASWSRVGADCWPRIAACSFLPTARRTAGTGCRKSTIKEKRNAGSNNGSR